MENANSGVTRPYNPSLGRPLPLEDSSQIEAVDFGSNEYVPEYVPAPAPTPVFVPMPVETEVFTPYEVVDTAAPAPAPVSVDADVLPQKLQLPQVQTLQPVPVSVSTPASTATSLTLPQFNFQTSVASCTDCNAAVVDTAATANAVAPAALPTSVTPLPPAPATTNWLLWGFLGAVGVYAFTRPDAGLSGAPAPAPDPKPQDLGRLPRKSPAKATRHVKELTIS